MLLEQFDPNDEQRLQTRRVGKEHEQRGEENALLGNEDASKQSKCSSSALSRTERNARSETPQSESESETDVHSYSCTTNLFRARVCESDS